MTGVGFFKSVVLPKMIASGAFGEDVVTDVRESRRAKPQLMSDVMFVDVTLTGGRHVPLVCKTLRDDPLLRRQLRLDEQFYNEHLVYREIAPLLGHRLLPTFYYGQSGRPAARDNLIVVEDLQEYSAAPGLSLDYEHCAMVFRRLGEFHGAGLAVKAAHPETFADTVGKLKEQRWVLDRKEELNYAYGEYAKRGANGMPVLTGDVFDVISDVLRPDEESVLCHGDFNANNMSFRYSQGRPTDVMFYDLATARHTSPIVDISFFLFMNTSADIRRRHFRQDLLPLYLEGVRGVAGPLAPSEERLWTQFQRKAVYGYIIAAFYLPIMADPRPAGPGDLSVEERVAHNLTRGGQSVTKTLAAAVTDLRDWRCVYVI